MTIYRLMEVRREGQPARFYVDGKQVSRDQFAYLEERAQELYGFWTDTKFGATRRYKLARLAAVSAVASRRVV